MFIFITYRIGPLSKCIQYLIYTLSLKGTVHPQILRGLGLMFIKVTPNQTITIMNSTSYHG